MRTSCVVWLVALLIAAPAAATESPGAAIDERCDGLAREADPKRNAPHVLVEVGDQWRERKADDEDVDTQASVWKRPDGTFVAMAFATPSGDWSQEVTYCFLADGTLGRSTATLTTFNVNAERDGDAPVRRVRTRHFAPDGRELAMRSRAVSVASGRPTDASFADPPEPIYPTVSALPFARLVP